MLTHKGTQIITKHGTVNAFPTSSCVVRKPACSELRVQQRSRSPMPRQRVSLCLCPACIYTTTWSRAAGSEGHEIRTMPSHPRCLAVYSITLCQVTASTDTCTPSHLMKRMCPVAAGNASYTYVSISSRGWEPVCWNNAEL